MGQVRKKHLRFTSIPSQNKWDQYMDCFSKIDYSFIQMQLRYMIQNSYNLYRKKDSNKK